MKHTTQTQSAATKKIDAKCALIGHDWHAYGACSQERAALAACAETAEQIDEMDICSDCLESLSDYKIHCEHCGEHINGLGECPAEH